MKLYTREQMIEAFNYGQNPKGFDWIGDMIDSLTAIQLPSDEEIEKHSTVLLYEKYPHHPISDTEYWKDMFFEGAKWMKEQILNQNK